MSHTVHIPTPLRQYTDKLDTVQVGGATVADAPLPVDDDVSGAEEAPLQRAGQAPALRQHLRQRRGHPLPPEGADGARRVGHDQHHPVGGRWQPVGDCRAARPRPGGGGPVQPSPDPARGRHGGAEEAEGRECAVCGRRRSRLARPALPRCRRHRPHRHRRLRRGGPEQPAAAGGARHAGRGAPKARFGTRRGQGDQPARPGGPVRDSACRRRTRSSSSSPTTSSSTAPTTSRRATW